MRADTYEDIEGRRLAEIVPRPYRRAAAALLRKDAVYTAVVFSPISREVDEGLLRSALAKLPEPRAALVVVAPRFTDDAREVVFAQGGLAVAP